MEQVLDAFLEEQRNTVDLGLASYLDNLQGQCPDELLEAMRYSLLAPGKRLRPLLVFMSAEACGGNSRQALPAACAVEMIHCYSLVHDDLPAMDDDDLRRGLPTCHKKFGDALAILVGDALQTYAFQIMAEEYPSRTAAACCLELARASGAAGMVGGQVEDLAWEKRQGDLSDLVSLHGKKTGALFRACLKMGAISVLGELEEGPEPELLHALDEYGRCFGLAFQITDDLLDVESTAANTGKRVGKDAERGKLTYPSLLGIPESRAKAEELAIHAQVKLEILGEGAERLNQLFQKILQRDR